MAYPGPNDVPNDIPIDPDTWKSNSSLYPVVAEDQFQGYSKKKLKGHQGSKIKPTISNYVASQKNSKLCMCNTAKQNFWIKITASRLSYELGLHGAKHFIGNSEILWKMDMKMTYFTLL